MSVVVSVNNLDLKHCHWGLGRGKEEKSLSMTIANVSFILKVSAQRTFLLSSNEFTRATSLTRRQETVSFKTLGSSATPMNLPTYPISSLAFAFVIETSLVWGWLGGSSRVETMLSFLI